MPIYAYRCETCGHAKDVLQKISDPVLDTCPACGAVTFRKQLTSAGFQLKGSGWYVTDFRGGDSAKAKAADAGSGDDAGKSDKADKAGTADQPGAAAKPPADTPAGAAAPGAAAPAAAKPAAATTPASPPPSTSS